MMRRLGWNADEAGIFDRPYFVNHISQLSPQWALVMNGSSLAQALVGRAKMVIDRQSHLGGMQDEGNISRNITPDAYVNALIAQTPSPTTIKYVLNEPGTGSADETLALCRWLAEVATRLVNRGFRAVLGNFSVGSINQAWASAGAYDPLLQVIAQHPNKLWLGVHEYAPLLLPAGVGTMDIYRLDEPAYVAPDKWAKSHQINPATTWYLLRANWLTIERARTLGLPATPTVVTEFGWDYMTSLPQNFYEHMARFRMPDFPALQGAYSLRHYWQAMFPQWSHAEAMEKQIEWAVRLYPSNYQGFLLFMYGGWHDKGFDFAHDRDFHNRLVRLNNTLGTPPSSTPVSPTPPPSAPLPVLQEKDPRWRSVRVTPRSRLVTHINIRHRPTTASASVSQIKQAGRDAWIMRDEARIERDGTWLPIRVAVGRNWVTGWVREDVATIFQSLPF